MIERVYSDMVKALVISLARNGESKYTIAKEIGISYTAICLWSRGYGRGKNGNFGIRGHSLKILQEVVEKGYFFTCSEDGRHCGGQARTLSKYIPMKIVRSCKKSVCVLKGREKEAMAAFLKKLNKKVLNAQNVALIGKAFGIRG